MAAEAFFDPPEMAMQDLQPTVEDDNDEDTWAPHTSQPVPLRSLTHKSQSDK